MIPLNCAHLEWLGDYQPTIFAYICSVFNEFDLQSLINYCIALEEVFQGCVNPLGCGNFHCCERVYFILITAIGKHFIHVKAACLRWCAGFNSYTNGAQMISIAAGSIPLVPHQA
jgi:hypothetical protein